MSVDAALASVRSQRSGAQPNAGFMRQLVDYEASLRRPPQDAGPQAIAVAEQGPRLGHGCAAQHDGVPRGAVATIDAALSSDLHKGGSTGDGHDCMCSLGRSPLGSDRFRSDPHAAATAGPPARGLVVDTGNTAWAVAKQSHSAAQSPASPRRLCGASFMAARCGGEDTEVTPDPAPSPQSSAGDYDSYEGTPARAAFVPAGWGVPAFSLIDGFPTLPSSHERASA